MDERELFRVRLADAEPDELWTALKRALATMVLVEADESSHRARFRTGISMTSWGQHMVAEIESDEIVVRGRPKGSLLTTTLGEKMHASGIERDVRRAVEAALGTHAPV